MTFKAQTHRRWTIAADTGGTFTDTIARDPAGAIRRLKVLSSSTLRLVARAVGTSENTLELARPLDGHPDALLGLHAHRDTHEARIAAATDTRLTLDRPLSPTAGWHPIEIRSPDEAPVFAARLLTGTPHDRPLPDAELRVATTRATNALLERAGEPVCLVINRGFSDLLRIDDQARPDLFDPTARRPDPIALHVIEIDARRTSDGASLGRVDEAALLADARQTLDAGATAAAVVLLHADRYPDDEQQVATILRHAGFKRVRCSGDVAPQIHLLSRAQTTVADASLTGIIRRYIDRILDPAPDARLRLMTSAGSLVGHDRFAPKDALLSGPAGGVVGARAAANHLGRTRIITFDMGGTSTDVARCDDAVPYTFEHTVGPARILAPAVNINTVAAGGGSICASTREGRTVGPDSAGAEPGPAAYGRGGPLTVTDVNLLMGRLDPDGFGIPIEHDPAERALDRAAQGVARDTGTTPAHDELLEGYLRIANQRMADAIHAISTREGVRPADYTLVAFGGAGPQHACAVADHLDITEILIPNDAGLLSADGLRQAPLERFATRQYLTTLPDTHELDAHLRTLEDDARTTLAPDLTDPTDPIRITRRIASLRPTGQDTPVDVDVNDTTDVPARFADAYHQLFGHAPPDRPIELVSLRVVASSGDTHEAAQSIDAPGPSAEPRTQRARFNGAWVHAPIIERASLPTGSRTPGPAIITDPHATTVVEPGWTAIREPTALRLARTATRREAPETNDPVETELFANRLTAIATRMGETLRRTAVSTNVRDRLDFSCAVLDQSGTLITNAPHVPVHLGALGVCVRAANKHPPIAPIRAGDVIVTNHPAIGGSHLPDVTVLAPVHASDGTRVAFVASRAHHAELGGRAPGSIPTDATSLDEEGVVIPPMRIVRAGRPDFEPLRARLTAPPRPSRAPDDNIADLTAAIASLNTAMTEIRALADHIGPERFIERTDTLRARAARAVRDHLTQREDGTLRDEEQLDDGTTIRVALTVDHGRLTVDFTGTDPVHTGNLNATPAIVRSAVVYVVRCMIDEPIPLNEGLLDPVEIILPPCFLNPAFSDDPADCPAVVGGNVETSQRIVSLLVRMLRLQAGSQATMNNIVFGNERVSFYETVCGGAGATPTHHGLHAVQTHMTNTRITDPELLELRYPVRLERFEIRQDSGGDGQRRGGNGVTRELTFLEPLRLSVLTQQRSVGPHGLDGGLDGAPGAQWLLRDDQRLPLPWAASLDVRPNDRLIMQTPGGAGWGHPDA